MDASCVDFVVSVLWFVLIVRANARCLVIEQRRIDDLFIYAEESSKEEESEAKNREKNAYSLEFLVLLVKWCFNIVVKATNDDEPEERGRKVLHAEAPVEDECRLPPANLARIFTASLSHGIAQSSHTAEENLLVPSVKCQARCAEASRQDDDDLDEEEGESTPAGLVDSNESASDDDQRNPVAEHRNERTRVVILTFLARLVHGAPQIESPAATIALDDTNENEQVGVQIVVHSVEQVKAPVEAEWDRHDDANDGNNENDERSGRASERVQIVDGCSHSLKEAERGVETEHKEHAREEKHPSVRRIHLVNSVRHGDEDERDVLRLVVSEILLGLEEANGTPDNKASKETGESVYKRHSDSVAQYGLVAILKVTGICSENTHTDSE